MKIVSVSQMRNLDYRSINEAGIPPKELMKRAGLGAGERILEYVSGINPQHVKRFVILAGKGNNGGDAHVIAKYLSEKSSCEVIIYSVCYIGELKGAAKFHAEHLPDNVQVHVKDKIKQKHFLRGDIIIDGLLGTGFKGKLKEPYYSWIKLVNSLHLPVVALDIPSGLNGDDGSIEDAAFFCDMTITMGLPKTGLIRGKGPSYCGKIKTVDIGIPQEFIDDTETEKCMITGNDAYYILKRLDMESYKNKNGSILVVGGSKMYSGAPFLTGKSALRAGAGIVTVAIPNSLQTCAPGIFALITRRIEDDGTGFFTDSSIPELKKLAEKADVIVIGPGMSDKQCCAGVFREILKLDKPKIVDADGLNLIAKDPAILTEKNGETVFTPHPGEAARLFKGFRENTDKYKRRADKAKKLSELLNGTVVYKGNRTVTLTPGRMPCINSSGGPALATAGSGDVLTGIIAANIGAGMSQYRASYLAAYLHGIAGEIADKGARGLIADDIAELIPYALKRASPFA